MLCVDDEKIVLDSLKAQLRSCFGNQFLYEFAESAEEAWMVIEELYEEKNQVSVVISDWLMPGMKGDELLIKVHQKYPKCVKILLTGQADEQAIIAARLNAQLQAYLPKPWSEQDLLDTIRKGLE